MELGDTIAPFVDIERAGIPIRIIGLTTADDFFQYSVSPGKVLSPNAVGEIQAKLAKEQGRELVIALTHIGSSEDESLVRNSSAIDVVIGGHSHTKITEIKWETNLAGRRVPIVQAWAHGLAVGSLLLDVKDDRSGMEVVEYKLHEIDSSIPPDPEMESFVSAASDKRNEIFGFRWDEIIGESSTPLTGYVRGHAVNRSSCWGYHMAKAAREAVNASVGVHIAEFEGVYEAAGPVTFGDIVDNFPHLRAFGDEGWEIVTVFMSGYKLRPLMYWLNRQGYGLSLSGLGYKEVIDLNDIEEKATYRIAFPAEVALAVNTSFPEYRKYLKGLKHTGQYYWPVMMKYVQENSPIKCE